MRKAMLIGMLALLVVPAAEVQAQRSGAGLGIIVGEPTGLSAKFWQSRRAAVDFAAAWSFEGDDAFHLHGDVIWHKFDLFNVDEGDLAFYYGIGARVRFYGDNDDEDDVDLGLRIPLGLDYMFGGGTPLDLFFELVPILELTPETDVSLNASLGLRYWF